MNSEGDDFLFAYSTNDADYVDMLLETRTVDDDLLGYFALPAGLGGTVYVRVQDADRTDGNTQLDTISVDEMLIISEETTVAPGAASAPSPANGATNVPVAAALSWVAGELTASHDVYFGTSVTPAFQGNQPGTTFNPGTLLNDTTYYWAIDEINNSGTTPGAVWWSFTTVAAAPALPAAPSGLSATAVSTTQINLSWTDNASNETGFKIERSDRNNSAYSQIATVGANVTSYSDTTLKKNTTYYYRVRATNADGDSAYSNEAYDTTLK